MDQTRRPDNGAGNSCSAGAEVVASGPVTAAREQGDADLAGLAAMVGDRMWTVPEDELIGLRRSLEATAARVAAVTLAVTREIDVRGAAVSLGAPSTAAWLAGSLRLHPGAARREVALAHA